MKPPISHLFVHGIVQHHPESQPPLPTTWPGRIAAVGVNFRTPLELDASARSNIVQHFHETVGRVHVMTRCICIELASRNFHRLAESHNVPAEDQATGLLLEQLQHPGRRHSLLLETEQWEEIRGMNDIERARLQLRRIATAEEVFGPQVRDKIAFIPEHVVSEIEEAALEIAAVQVVLRSTIDRELAQIFAQADADVEELVAIDHPLEYE